MFETPFFLKKKLSFFLLGVDNMAFNDTNNDGPISSPPDR